MLRVSAGKTGLSWIRYDKTSLVWADEAWRDWPSVTSGQDRGSDCFCALHACMYKPEIQLNVKPFWEYSHDACNDLELSYAAAGQMNLVLVFLVVHSLSHGHDKEENMRF